MNMKKAAAGALAGVMIMACSIGGTMAWLSAKSNTVENTFTVGKVAIELYETKDGKTVDGLDLKGIPGETLGKNPTVKMLKGSEDSYVYVQVIEKNNTTADGKQIVEWTPDTAWKLIDEDHNIYTKEGSMYAQNFDLTVKFLKGDEVKINEKLTSEDVAALDGQLPELNFQAAAVQRAYNTRADADAQAIALLIADDAQP